MQRHGLLEKLFVSDLTSRFDSISLVNSRHFRGNGIHPDVEEGQPCVTLDMVIRIGNKKEARYGFFCNIKELSAYFRDDPWIQSLGTVILSLVLTLALRWTLRFIVLPLGHKTKTEVDDITIRAVKGF